MLVTKTYQQDTIVSFKLVNGDEIVAKVVNDTDANYEISKPCTVIPSQQGLGLVQSLFTSELNNIVVLDKKHVMMSAKTVKDVENHYIKTTTGIEPVDAGAIIV